MRIGILGAGQLAQMLSDAARSLNIDTLCFTDQTMPPASHSSSLFMGSLDDKEALKLFAEKVDVITLENEFISTETLRFLKQCKPVYPDENALAITQDRLLEKQCFNGNNIPCAEYHAIDTIEEFIAAAKEFKHQCILKTRTMGYDGKGQWSISDQASLDKAIIGLDARNLILERKIPFEKEVSIIATRNNYGEIVYYPLTENSHKEGILRQSIAPFDNAILQKKAEQYAKTLLDKFQYVDTMAIEFFIVNNDLVANEIAPRVHNSGHWTIEGSDCSQFENHLRAVAGITLKTPCVTSKTTMFNIIGTFPEELKVMDDCHVHDYFKKERPGRKLGHVTVTDVELKLKLIEKAKFLTHLT